MMSKFLLSFLIFNLFFSLSYAAEKILSCKMNYGISGENDETDIEFKNLSTIDQTQTFFLDLEKNWLSVKSEKDYKGHTICLLKELKYLDYQLIDKNLYLKDL